MPTRRTRVTMFGSTAMLCAALAMPLSATAPAVADATPGTDPAGNLTLLSDPFLQLPGSDEVRVVWMTEFEGSSHTVLVGEGVGALSPEEARAAAAGAAFDGVRVIDAATATFSRLAEDNGSRIPEAIRPSVEAGIVARDVSRHEARVDGLAAGERTPYRVVSIAGDEFAVSGTFSLAPAPRPGDGSRVLITSDHQAMANTPANLQMAAETIGDIDAVFLAGDLVNQPDRASEWFDDTRGSAFFAALQGNGGRVDNNGVKLYHGGEILQHAPLFPAVGNHEVQGRIDGMPSIGASYNAAIPRAVAEAEYEKVAATVNPDGDPAVRDQWIENNSFSTTTYEEMFTLPDDSPGGETYYATTFGDIRLVSLYSTRIWRGTTADPDPAARTASSRYQEAAASLDDPLAQGYGEHIFESLAVGSEQYEWLRDELDSEEFQDARYRIVMLHEGPQGLGDNVMPHFADPVRIEERNDAGEVIGIRYEYPPENNVLLRDLTPLLENSGVDLVHNGHSHLWNRFRSDNGVNYLETSNTGNTYGAFHPLSGRLRPIPPAPWDASNYLAQGNPGGLEPIVPNVQPFLNADGIPEPYVQSNDLAVFAMLDTAANELVSYAYDVRTPDVAPWVIDRFEIGRAGEGPGEPGTEDNVFLTNSSQKYDADIDAAFGVDVPAGAAVVRGDWDGDGVDTLAWREGNRWTFASSNENGGGELSSMWYGRAGDEPFVGDFDKDGRDTVGVRRGNVMYLRDDLSGGNATTSFTYGRASDELGGAGDFDGDGVDTLAVRRGNLLHVRNSLTAGYADDVVSYGKASDEVLIADVDGNGRDDMVARRGAQFHLRDSLTPGNATTVLEFGAASDVALMGDWDGDRTDTAGVVRPADVA